MAAHSVAKDHVGFIVLGQNMQEKDSVPLDLICTLVAFFGGGNFRPILCFIFWNKKKCSDKIYQPKTKRKKG